MDKYTEYPEALKKRIQGVNKYYEDKEKEEKRWASLTPEQQEAEIKEAERLNALSLEEKEAEARKRLETPPISDSESPPPASEETLESLKEKLVKAEAALSTLRGKYDKEPAEMQRQINFLTENLSLLQKELLKAKTVVEPKLLKLSEALKEDIDNLKQEMAPEIVDKIIIFQEKVLELARQDAKQTISEVATKFDGRFASTAREKFDRDLIEAYPNWEKMWHTEDFQAFLKEDDGLSGHDRYASIDDAFKKNNSRIVIKAFDLFTDKNPETVPPTSNVDQDKLKRRVSAPRSSSSGGPTPNKQPDKMTPKEAREALIVLSTNYTRGRYKGTREKYDKEYAKLHAISIGSPSG